MSQPLDSVASIRDRLVSDQISLDQVRDIFDGLDSDQQDPWLDAVWDVDPLVADSELPAGCVPYLPCSARLVVDTLRLAGATSDDVFIDIGAGLGRACFLAHMTTGAKCVGIEIQGALVAGAHERALHLGLEHLRFVHGDTIAKLDSLNDGTVFFLYCPFDNARLSPVLDHLQTIAATRRIHIGCVRLPTLERSWLESVPSPSPELHVYRSLVR